MFNKSMLASQHKRFFFVSILLLLLLTAIPLQSMAQEMSVEEQTAAIVTAANAFLDSLDEEQLDAVMFDFDDAEQRENWSNLPTGLYTRAGLSYGTMSEEQRELALGLLQIVLSEEGYEKVYGTMVSDEILHQTSTGLGGAGTVFGFGEYYISFLGTPSETEPWILQWGGHHFALNITFVGTETVLSPSHTGCQPCAYIIDDQDVNVLGDEYTFALELVNSLDAEAQEQAILDYSVTNLVLGPGEEDRVLEPEGLPASEMTEEQQQLLLDIIGEWVNITNKTAAAARMAQIEAELPETYFAWSGDIDADSSSYFRITGPSLLIEYAPQGNGGGGGNGGPGSNGGPGGGQPPADGGDGGQFPGNDSDATASGFELELGEVVVLDDDPLYHVHTIYRDPTNAYGSALVEE